MSALDKFSGYASTDVPRNADYCSVVLGEFVVGESAPTVDHAVPRDKVAIWVNGNLLQKIDMFMVDDFSFAFRVKDGDVVDAQVIDFVKKPYYRTFSGKSISTWYVAFRFREHWAVEETVITSLGLTLRKLGVAR